MTELPKNGWYVELPDDKNHIDLDKLSNALNKEYEFYYEYKLSIVCKYYAIRADGIILCTDDFEDVEQFKNVTHLFLRKPEQSAAESNRTEPKLSEPEIIEIDGKKFRLVPEQANFKNCDIVMKDGKEYEFIGYYEADVILRECVKGELSQHENVGLFKLEEVKTKVWHYAIYRDEDELCHSNFYSHENLLKKDRPDALEYRTFEEQL